MIIRDASIEDAEVITVLLTQLGHPMSLEMVERQFKMLSVIEDCRIIVAERSEKIVGVMSLHWTPLLHRDKPMGRITALVVDESARGKGVGTRLADEAVRIFTGSGCGAVEVTSNVRRTEAHEFYRKLGFEQPLAYFRLQL